MEICVDPGCGKGISGVARQEAGNGFIRGIRRYKILIEDIAEIVPAADPVPAVFVPDDLKPGAAQAFIQIKATVSCLSGITP